MTLVALVVSMRPSHTQLYNANFYIKPNDSTVCTSELPSSCLTLEQFVNEVVTMSSVIKNVTLHFLQGQHYLHSDLQISYAETVILRAVHDETSTIIRCLSYASLLFDHVSVVEINHVVITGCGKLDKSSVLKNSAVTILNTEHSRLLSAAILESTGSAISIINSNFLTMNATISESSRHGLHLINSSVIFKGENSLSNNNGSAVNLTSSSINLHGQTVFAGNTAENGGAIWSKNSTICARGSTIFTNNTAGNSGGAIYSVSGGLIAISGKSEFTGNVALRTTTSYSTWATYDGGAIYVRNISEVTITGLSLFQSNVAGDSGGGIFAVNTTLTIDGETCFLKNRAQIKGGAIDFYGPHSIFTMKGTAMLKSNYARDLGGGIDVHNSRGVNLLGSNITINSNLARNGGGFYARDVLFINITGVVAFRGSSHDQGIEGGGGMSVTNVKMMRVIGIMIFDSNRAYYGGGFIVLNVTVDLNGNITFVDNSANISGGALFIRQSVVIFSNLVKFQNNSAVNGPVYSSGGAIFAQESILIFSKLITFQGNSAGYGGAMTFTENSVCFLFSTVRVLFINNRALLHGGGIYIDDSGHMAKCIHTTEGLDYETTVENEIMSHCPIQFNDQYREDIHIDFINNIAKTGGSAIYGGILDYCYNNTALLKNMRYTNVNINAIINISESNISSSIASDPNGLCICSNYPKQCSETSIQQSIYPGETIVLSILAVGQRNGIVPAIVQASLNASNAELLPLQHSQSTTMTCSNLEYTVMSSSSENLTMTLAVAGVCSTLGQELTVHVEMKKCPRGFELSQEFKVCTCESRLRKLTNTCNVTDQTIFRDKHFWIGYSNDTTYKGLIIQPNCPFDYCTSAPINFTLDDPDVQCNHNRTGLLCGQCKPGFSLVLTGSVCREHCSFFYTIYHTVTFLATGVVVIVFLFILKLTVAAGTVNGFVFYANVVYSDHNMFFPSGRSNWMTTIIAWVNLSSGSSHCFYSGMDEYVRTWLQFLFPFYIWALCILMILLSRRNACLTRLLGNNPVALLATLFLLSYAKILYIFKSVVSFTKLEYPDNQSRIAWLYDANVSHTKHAALIVFSVVMFLLLLPYTLLLLTNQWLHAWGERRLFSWVNSPRIKFFLDAHNAPFKPTHRYWTGLLLIARFAVQLVFIGDVLGNPNFDISAFCIVGTALVVWQTVICGSYINNFISILETTFMVNIVFLAAGTYFAGIIGTKTDLPSYISAGIALGEFALIVLFHIYLCMKNTLCYRRCMAKQIEEDNTMENDELLHQGRVMEEEEEEDNDESMIDFSEAPEMQLTY